MKAQLSLEFLAVTCVIILSVATLSTLVETDFTFESEQGLALLIDDLTSFGAPFHTDTQILDKNCQSHKLGDARTITKELLVKGGYRYRTHSVKQIETN